MIYQLPNGRIIEMTLEQYLDLTDDELKDLNYKIDKKATIDKEVYESYPELNPQNDAPWAVNFGWDVRQANKIISKKRRAMKDGKVATFKTREEAERFANDYWMNTESIENIISNTVQKISTLEGHVAPVI